MKTYNIGTCEVPGCGKVLSNAGFARTAHMRVHVRRGEAREVRTGKGRDAYSRFVWNVRTRIEMLPYKLAQAVLDHQLTLQQAEAKAAAGEWQP